MLTPPRMTAFRLTLVLLAVLAAGGAHAQSVRGIVFEVVNPEAPRHEWRRTPAANAFVIVHLTGTIPRLGHGEPVCLQASVGRTDEQGRFDIPAAQAARKPHLVIRDEPRVAVYKPGFDGTGEPRSRGPAREFSLVRTKLTPLERAGVLALISEYGCRDDNAVLLPLTDPQGVLPAFHKALYDEAEALAPLPPGDQHYLETVRQRTGLGPPPAEPPVQIRVLPRPRPLPAEPAPGARP